MNIQPTLQRHLPFRRFRKSEEGGITIFSLYLLMGMAIVGAFALDFTHLIAARSQLQVAADVAAHTALYHRMDHSAADSKQEAIKLAAAGMPNSRYGDVLVTSDITFGHWDYGTQTFTADNSSNKAVMVSTSRASSKSNSIGSYLFQFVGKDDWDVVTPAVFVTYQPTCLRQGLVGEDIVDVQSGNMYVNGFCVHSNTHVSVSSNNFFELGTIVSMPDLQDLDMPNSGFATNDGLEVALRSGSYGLGIIQDIVDGVFEEKLRDQVSAKTNETIYERTYINNNTVNNIVLPSNPPKLHLADIKTNKINTLYCGPGGGKVTMVPDTGVAFSDFILITDCEIKFNAGTALENVTILSTNTSASAFEATAAGGFRLGVDDDCAVGGAAQLVTMGGIHIPAALEMYGSQMLAVGDIDFEANAAGLQGVSIVSGGRVDGSSGGTMGFCPEGMDENYGVEYFRLAK